MVLKVELSEGDVHDRVQEIEELKDTHTLVSEFTLCEIPIFTEVWAFVLGFSALLDFLSIVIPFAVNAGDDEQSEEEKENPFLFQKPPASSDNEVDIPWYTGGVEWIERNATEISITFSLLWFVHAFISARRNRLKTLRERDKKRLMQTAQKSKETGLLDLAVYDEWISGGWGPFFRTLTLQSVLLPVGFFMLCLHVWRGNFDADRTDEEGIEIVYDTTEDMPAFRETLTTHTTQSVAYAIIHHFLLVASRVAGAQIRAVQKEVKRFVRRLTRRLAFMAIKHPKTFARRLRKILTVLRWIQYLAPLIGTGNKLLGNVKDLAKKYAQKRRAARAARIRRQLWKHLTDEELEEAAAVVIQKTWRAHRTAKAVAALKIFRGDKAALAAIKMQRVFKGMLARARLRLLKKKKELKKLQDEERGKLLQNKGSLSAEERRRLYQLQEEVGVEQEKSLSQKLLLRPNTTFAVTWKALFIICVIFEITHLILKPRLKRYSKEIPGKPETTAKIIEYKVVPIPIEEWEECSPPGMVPLDSIDEEGRKPLKRRLQHWRNEKRLAKWKREEHPWYCDNAGVIVAQSIYIEALKFILEETILIIGMVCFLDVPVTFWTGEFDEGGSLVPKPFFTRWILPGLVLQLVLNPAMEEVSQIVKQLIKGSIQVGPVRVVRWSFALFIPCTRLFFSWVEYAVWLPMTISQNYLSLKQ